MNNMLMDDFLRQVQVLSTTEKQSLVDQILSMLQGQTPEAETHNDFVHKHNANHLVCPHCGIVGDSKKIIRRGYNKNGAQRYFCKECGHFFVPSTNTALSHTHKSADVWKRFIEMTITGESIAECAVMCGIAYQTAFTWRHKILNVFKKAQESTMMDGIVEVDEMLVKLNFKGNHVQGKFGRRKKSALTVNDMPRKAFRRGTDNKTMSSKERACVFCMVENGNQTFYAAVPGIGFMTNPMLDATVKLHINKNKALMIADNYKTTSKYFDDNNYNSLILSSNTSDNPHDHKPEIAGEKRDKHIQHVNAMHHHIRDFLRPYCGVSSKYLSNYIALFVWLKNCNALRRRNTVLNDAEKLLSSTDAFISREEILAAPRVPCVA